MKPYPRQNFETLEDVLDVLRLIVQERKSDIGDFDNLINRFISGRKSAKIPLSSTDISDNDRIGDFSFDKDYIYIVVNDSGNAKWRRVALQTW